MSKYKVTEKKNPLAIHAICDSEKSAKLWIEKAASYIEQGFFTDKTLTLESFRIEKYENHTNRRTPPIHPIRK